jgi:predicted ATPase
MFYYAFVLMEYGFYRDAMRASDQLVSFAQEQLLPLWLAGGNIIKGSTICRAADQGDGTKLVRRGLADWRSTSAEFHMPQLYLYLSQSCLTERQFDEGLDAIRMGYEQAGRTGEHWFTAELHRMEGEVLLARQRDAMPIIEKCFDTALELARNQHSKTFELRAAMSLAKIWTEGGEQSRARSLLEPLYGWFKEGTDTRDLMEARDLLDQLR